MNLFQRLYRLFRVYDGPLGIAHSKPGQPGLRVAIDWEEVTAFSEREGDRRYVLRHLLWNLTASTYPDVEYSEGFLVAVLDRIHLAGYCTYSDELTLEVYRHKHTSELERMVRRIGW